MRPGKGEEACRERGFTEYDCPAKAVVWVRDSFREVKGEDEDHEHHSRQCRGEPDPLIQDKAEGACEQRESEKDDPEGMKWKPVRDGLGKGADVDHVLGSEAGEGRGGEDGAEDDDSFKPGSREEFSPRVDEAYHEENHTSKPRPEYVMRKQGHLFPRRHTSAHGGRATEWSIVVALVW